MEIRRFYSKNKKSGAFIIDGEEAHHAIKVLRYKVGYLLTVFDGSGKDYNCTVREVGKDYIVAGIDSVSENDTEHRVKLHLYQGLAKLDKMELIVQKAVELGISEITPVITARSEKETKFEKLEKIAIGAAKQCGASKLTKINKPIYIQEIKADTLTILAYEGEKTRTLKEVSLGRFPSINLIVGAEGGFTEDEAQMLNEKGALSVSLGKRILRTETAGIVLSTVILYKAGSI